MIAVIDKNKHSTQLAIERLFSKGTPYLASHPELGVPLGIFNTYDEPDYAARIKAIKSIGVKGNLSLYALAKIIGIKDPLPQYGDNPGCTDPTAANYDPLANINDGSCYYAYGEPLSVGGLYTLSNVNGEAVLAGLGATSGGSHSCAIEYAAGVTFTAPGFNLLTTNYINSGTNYTVVLTSAGKIRYATSTRKLKNTILPLSDTISVDSILKLEGICFKYKSNDSNLLVGFIAEEVAKICPTFAIWGYDYVYDEKGQRVQTSDSDLSYHGLKLKSDDLVPMSINTRAILAALLEKTKELESILKVLEG